MQTRTCTFMLCAIAMVIIAEKALAQDIQNPLSKAQELGNKTLSLPQVTEPKRKPFLSPPSPVADRNDLGGEKVKATICLQGGKPRELLPNVLGLFHRILMPAEGTMQIKVTYLDGDPLTFTLMKVMVLNCFQCGGNCLTVGNPITNRRFHSSKESGIALIITLALIVLVTVTAVAFFTRATSNRSVEASRANQILARLLAESGSDYTVSNFIMEIVTNSTVNPTLPGTYIPTNDFVPVQLLSSNIPTNLWSNSFANLVRQSAPPGAGQAAGSTLPFETNASSNDSTAIPSENGRLVDTNRWSAPQLIAGGFTSTNQLPNWIYINRDGTLTGTISSANASNIIGRFAYNAYNIGGLLDANVAGYPPDAITPGDTNMPVLKGTLAGADLTQLPGITPADVASFINWRNSNADVTSQI